VEARGCPCTKEALNGNWHKVVETNSSSLNNFQMKILPPPSWSSREQRIFSSDEENFISLIG
jgi:hypothetical protein